MKKQFLFGIVFLILVSFVSASCYWDPYGETIQNDHTSTHDSRALCYSNNIYCGYGLYEGVHDCDDDSPEAGDVIGSWTLNSEGRWRITCTPSYKNTCDYTNGCGGTRTVTLGYNSCNLSSNTACGTESTCDGIDNDCDGVIDDEFDIGDACSVGVGECVNTGSEICDTLTTTKCSVVQKPKIDEKCDVKDWDCDGDNYNGFDFGNSCTVGVGECENTGSKICDGFLTTKCSVIPSLPGLESCNGKDDDCDGVIDNSFDCKLGTPNCKPVTCTCDAEFTPNASGICNECASGDSNLNSCNEPITGCSGTKERDCTFDTPQWKWAPWDACINPTWNCAPTDLPSCKDNLTEYGCGDCVKFEKPCRGDQECVDGLGCVTNYIEEFNGKQNSETNEIIINYKCGVDSIGNTSLLIINAMTGEELFKEENIDCTNSLITKSIDATDYEKDIIYTAILRVSDCANSPKEIYININKKVESAIPDTSLISIILVLLIVSILITKKKD